MTNRRLGLAREHPWRAHPSARRAGNLPAAGRYIASPLDFIHARPVHPRNRMMRSSLAVTVPLACAVLLAFAPLRAQPVPDSLCDRDPASAAVHDAAYANTALAAEPDAPLARYTCAYDPVSFAVSFPAGWDVQGLDEDYGVAVAASLRAPRFVVRGQDQLPEPRQEGDESYFWSFATALAQARQHPLDEEIAAFRERVRDTDGARDIVTRVMLQDARLRLLPFILSTENEGVVLRDTASELRTLAGRRAGWLLEVYEDDGQTWHRETYATIHQARIYAISFSAPEADFRRLQPLWRRVLDSAAIEVPSPEAPPAAP